MTPRVQAAYDTLRTLAWSKFVERAAQYDTEASSPCEDYEAQNFAPSSHKS